MNKEKLEWIKGYEGIYIITSYGRIFSMTRRDNCFRVLDGGELKTHLNGAGYKFVTLYKGGEGKMVTIHRLVCNAFIPNPENKPCVDHIDGNKMNNNVTNLRWCTYKENMNNPVTLAHAKEIVDKTVHLGADNPFSRKVGQYNANDDLIATFNSVGEASRMTGISHHSIQRSAKGTRFSGGGYIWKYLSEPKYTMPHGTHNAFNKQKIEQYDKKGNLIAEYESIQAAATAVGCDASNISRAARGVTSSSKGFIWKYKKD